MLHFNFHKNIPTSPTLGVTGHRPDKLGGYFPNPQADFVRANTKAQLEAIQPKEVITGMALGFDQWVARICLQLGIPFIAALPCDDQDRRWRDGQRDAYRQLLAQAARVELVSPGYYSSAKMLKRNRWIVDRSDLMMAAWNRLPSGGTASCVRYAMKKGKQIVFVELVPER